jgi:hypothetical protein
MKKMITVNFTATAEVSVGGSIEVPEGMVQHIEDGDVWSLEMERYISDNYDDRHVDLSSIDKIEDFEITFPKKADQ